MKRKGDCLPSPSHFRVGTGSSVGNVKHLFPWLCPTCAHNDQEYTEPNTSGVLRPFGVIVPHLASYRVIGVNDHELVN